MTIPQASGRPLFDAVLCDIDNVIRVFDSSCLFALERAAGLAEGTTMKVAFAPERICRCCSAGSLRTSGRRLWHAV